jgi:signal transduction histidine kinase
MSSAAEPRAPSIARGIFLLVIMSVLVANLVLFGITFRGPPPRIPRGIDSIADALKTGTAPGGRGPPLYLTSSGRPPVAASGQRPVPGAAARLAAVMGVPPTDVVAFAGDRPGGSEDAFLEDFTCGWHVAGLWRIASRPPMPAWTHWHWMVLLALFAAIATLSVPAWLIARAISRPLRRLADAADQAGTGARLPPLPGGSQEVRDLSRAVTTMHARLASHAEGRTAMLAAIAHDLGTPLSRIAYRIEGLPEAERARAAADIEEMRAMIRDTLAFARDEANSGSASRLDLGSLLDALVEDMADAGAPVTLAPGPRLVVRGDSGALRRLFANLLDNAVRYGERARVGWDAIDGSGVIWIDDDGPGIDPAQAEQLFQPFVRGDPSRNRSTGGTGLGLAIVRSIATRHGGAVTLERVWESGSTGTRARIVLPLAVLTHAATGRHTADIPG